MKTNRRTVASSTLFLASVLALGCGSAESRRPPSDTPPAQSGVCPMHAEGRCPCPMNAEGRCPCPMSAEGGGESCTCPMSAEGGSEACTCPMHAQGVRVAAEDVDGGAALVLTAAEGGDVEAVRRHAERMAAMHAARGGPGAPPGASGRGMARHPNMHAAEVRAEPTDDGARVVFTPSAEGDLEALREEVRAHAEAMNSGRCPMMQ